MTTSRFWTLWSSVAARGGDNTSHKLNMYSTNKPTCHIGVPCNTNTQLKTQNYLQFSVSMVGALVVEVAVKVTGIVVVNVIVMVWVVVIEKGKTKCLEMTAIPKVVLVVKGRKILVMKTIQAKLPMNVWAQGSKLPMNVWAQGSKLPMNVWAQGSKLPINVWAQGSKLPINVWAQGSKLPINVSNCPCLINLTSFCICPNIFVAFFMMEANECTKAAILLISFPVGKRQIFTTLLSINILFPSVKKIARSDMLSLDIPVRFLESAFYGKSNLPDFGKTVYKDFLENSGFPDFYFCQILIILFASVGVICEK